MIRQSVLLAVLAVTGCSGAAGPAGEQGPIGPAGATGPSGPAGPGIATRSTAQGPSTRCPAGGTVVEFGIDANNDGVLQDGEVDPAQQQTVCNGQNGANGQDGMNGTNGVDGMTGPVGPIGPVGPEGPVGPQGPAVDAILNQVADVQDAGFRIGGGAEIGGLLSQNTSRALNAATAPRDLYRASLLPGNNPLITIKDDGAFSFGGFVRDVGNTTGCAMSIPATGAGTRFMWHACRGSLRFGRVPVGQTNWDDSNMDDFTFAGGNQVTASGYGAFAYGDQVNVSSTVGVGFGSAVNVSGTAGFSSGASNVCSGFACTAIGYNVRAGGQGSVALGYRTTANNDYSVAIGYRASNNTHTGTFVWGDESTTDSVRNQADNEFRIRANGGIRLRVSTASNGNTPGAGGNVGCDLTVAVPSWTCASSRDLKENFVELDGETVLTKLRNMPVTQWNFTTDPADTPHVGPVAQDFYAAFKLGDSESSVGLQDLSGVALAAAKALEERTTQLDARTREVEALKEKVDKLEGQLQRIEKLLAEQNRREAK